MGPYCTVTVQVWAERMARRNTAAPAAYTSGLHTQHTHEHTATTRSPGVHASLRRVYMCLVSRLTERMTEDENKYVMLRFHYTFSPHQHASQKAFRHTPHVHTKNTVKHEVTIIERQGHSSQNVFKLYPLLSETPWGECGSKRFLFVSRPCIHY